MTSARRVCRMSDSVRAATPPPDHYQLFVQGPCGELSPVVLEGLRVVAHRNRSPATLSKSADLSRRSPRTQGFSSGAKRKERKATESRPSLLTSSNRSRSHLPRRSDPSGGPNSAITHSSPGTPPSPIIDRRSFKGSPARTLSASIPKLPSGPPRPSGLLRPLRARSARARSPETGR